MLLAFNAYAATAAFVSLCLQRFAASLLVLRPSPGSIPMQGKGLDWKNLLKQQPHPSSVVKKKTADRPPTTPSVPSSSTASGDISAANQPALPILFLKRQVPKDENNKRQGREPALDMLKKLSEAKSKAALLLTTGNTSSEQAGSRHVGPGMASVLQSPLPAPEHVHQDTWYCFDEDSNGDASTSNHPPSSYSGLQGSWYNPCTNSTATQQQRSAVVESMRTSATGQGAGSSLLTTAHSLSMRWQSALARLRHLQQQTEEAFMQGDRVAA